MKAFSARNPIPIALVGIVVIVLGVVVALNADNLPIIGGGTTYTADVAEAVGLTSGDSVRIAGVKVGKVEDVTLDQNKNKVQVRFKISDAFVGNKSQVAIKIQTALGQKYLSVESQGDQPWDPNAAMQEDSGQSVYFDVQDAVNGLTNTVGKLNINGPNGLEQSFAVLSQTFANTPSDVKGALSGLSRLSQTISSKDQQLSQLLSNTSQLSKTLSDRDAEIQKLISDGNLLLGMIQDREQAITALLTGAQRLSQQLTGLVNDNNATLKPVLDQLNQFTTMLSKNQNSLRQGLAELAPFTRLFNNVLGNGRWFDNYICGLLPPAFGPANSGMCNP